MGPKSVLTCCEYRILPSRIPGAVIDFFGATGQPPTTTKEQTGTRGGQGELSQRSDAPVRRTAQHPGDPAAEAPLLDSKVIMPDLPAGLIERPRLVESLNAGLAGGLTLVGAPAGFGKTVLL